MKNLILSLGVLTAIGALTACSHSPMASDGLSPAQVDKETIEASNTSPTPNTGYNRVSVEDATAPDPEGDVAPVMTCRRGEVERRQSGKVVCVPADRVDPNSTMTGR